ncbi:hypothetical protein CSOJ01_15079 [Colletotrichum sojae]|uniref:Uncharacterized protein n=1 Tax=Colletotrichum sojae TaxID=2175907 RepID=A0A8H6INE3_9PEZI|nr:hypothetical protein CSOJ01_15079 [Colletotrichum sojae]
MQGPVAAKVTGRWSECNRNGLPLVATEADPWPERERVVLAWGLLALPSRSFVALCGHVAAVTSPPTHQRRKPAARSPSSAGLAHDPRRFLLNSCSVLRLAVPGVGALVRHAVCGSVLGDRLVLERGLAPLGRTACRIRRRKLVRRLRRSVAGRNSPSVFHVTSPNGSDGLEGNGGGEALAMRTIAPEIPPPLGPICKNQANSNSNLCSRHTGPSSVSGSLEGEFGQRRDIGSGARRSVGEMTWNAGILEWPGLELQLSRLVAGALQLRHGRLVVGRRASSTPEVQTYSISRFHDANAGVAGDALGRPPVLERNLGPGVSRSGPYPAGRGTSPAFKTFISFPLAIKSRREALVTFAPA